jgi:hypothetical protein
VKILHPSKMSLLIVKLVLGGFLCLWLAAHDSNGLSPRDLLVGGGMVAGSTLSVFTTIEQGTELFLCGHVALALILIDAATGLWLNVSPFLDKMIR